MHDSLLPITPVFCFVHARRGFFKLADIEKNAREGLKGKPVSPIALEAVRRLDALFEIERAINGCGADERRAVRQEKSKPLLDDMHAWLLRERETLSRSAEVLKPINYMLKRWADSPASSTMAGSASATMRPKERCVASHWEGATGPSPVPNVAPTAPPSCSTLITSARLNDVDPKAWLADVLARVADLPASRLHELLPWEWKRLRQAEKPADQQVA